MIQPGMITAREIHKSYGTVRVLDGVSFEVPRGTVVALLGPNGAGKTTMIRILSTLVKPNAGTAVVAGHDVVTEAKDVRRAISLTGQYAAVDELLTGEENLLLMAKLRRLRRAAARARTADLLESFDLADAAHRRVKTYSGGMRRRLDLAISVLTHPPVIFLDEPTTGLDPRSRQTMWEVIGTLVRDGTTILLTTQYLEEADRLADSIVVLDGGKIISTGTPDDLKRQVAVEEVELGFALGSDLERAALVLTLDHGRIDAPRRALSIATDGRPDEVRRLLDVLDQHDIPVDRLSLRRPTLDEVFLDLTNREVA